MLTPSITPASMNVGIQAEEAKRGRVLGHEDRMWFAAFAAIRIWLGNDWLKKRLGTHEFFNPRPLGLATDGFMRQAAIFHLAELLLNLQHVEGVERVVGRIAEGQRIVDDVAELAGAAVLQRAGISFRFVKPTGIKGADYDVEATLGGELVCFEMKGKVANPSKRTVVETLRGAAEQLPQHTPNVVVMQPPNDWMLTSKGFDALDGGIAEYFRKSRRIARVVVHADEWRTFHEEGREEAGAVVSRRSLVHMHPDPAVSFPVAVAHTKWLEETGHHWLGTDRAVGSAERVRYLQMVQRSFAEQIASEQRGETQKSG